MMSVADAIRRVCELARRQARPDVVARAKARQGAVFAWVEADYLPLQFGGSDPGLRDLPSFDWREQFEDPAKSFIMQMQGVVCSAASGSDQVLGIRADLGVVNGPSIFGAGYEVPTHTKPWVTRPVPKEELQTFVVPDDVRALGTMPRVIEHTQHHLAVLRAEGLADLVDVHHCDTQGPLDIAHQARGHEIYVDMYEDPAFVHHLLAQATSAYVAVSRLGKKLAGEGNWGNASGYWMERGGVRMCEDTSILLSPKLYEEFVAPCNVRALTPFGSGWVHYCGGVAGTGRPEGLHLHDAYCANALLAGVNFTTARDLVAEIKKLLRHRKAYIGGFPRATDESLEACFRRVLALCPGRRGLLLGADVRAEEREGAMALWHRLQDELFPRA